MILRQDILTATLTNDALLVPCAPDAFMEPHLTLKEMLSARFELTTCGTF